MYTDMKAHKALKIGEADNQKVDDSYPKDNKRCGIFFLHTFQKSHRP